MTVSSRAPLSKPVPLEGPSPPAAARARARRVCPYLISRDGAWRSATAMRGQRCGALAPPAPLGRDKQRRLCLTAGHAACPAFLAAAGGERSLAPELDDPWEVGPRVVTRWSLVRPTPLVLDPGRVAAATTAVRRPAVPVAVAGLAAVVVVALVALRGPVLEGTGGVAGASATPAIAARATQPPASLPVAAASPSPATSASGALAPPSAPALPPPPSAASTVASPAPAPTTAATRTYTVRAGDTMYGIAMHFETTVRKILELNGLTSTDLMPGQVLKLP